MPRPFYVLRGAAISISDNVPRRFGREIFARIRASSMRAYIIRAKVKCFYQKVGKNVKCALKPQSDERAREMHDDTAARSSCIAVLWAHQIMSDKARKNLTARKQLTALYSRFNRGA